MMFQLERNILLSRLQIVQGIVERREKLPILGNVLLVLKDGILSFTTTDMEVEVVARLALDGGTDGETTVPARKLLDITRSLPEDSTVEFSMEGSRASLRAGRSRFTLNSLPAADFPVSDPVEGEVVTSLAQKELRRLIELTHFAMAVQDVRYYLNGLMLEFRDRSLRAVSTDGHRLAQAEVELADSAGAELRQAIVPRKAVLELSRFLQAEESAVEIVVGRSSVVVKTDGVTFSSRLVDGRFPDYNRVIPRPEQCDKQAEADRESVRRSLQRASVLSSERFRTVRLSFGPDSLHVAANNPDQEEAEDEVDVTYAGEKLEIGFNVAYLMEALAAVPADTVLIRLSDAGSSCLITPKDDDGSCRYVVMPMRL